jgi:hypothetical protein
VAESKAKAASKGGEAVSAAVREVESERNSKGSRDKPKGAAVQARDRALMRFIARFRFCSVAQVAKAHSMSETRAYKRTQALRRLGLLAFRRPLLEWPGAVYVTADGCSYLGLPRRREPRLDVASYGHELAVSELCARLERNEAIRRVLTERELRELTHETGEQWFVPIEAPKSIRRRGTQKRWPDLAVEDTDGRLIAIELEGAVKGSERWRRILAGYADSERYAGCLWHVREPQVARRLSELSFEDLLAAAGAPRALHLRPWPGLGAEEEGQIAELERAHRQRLAERERERAQEQAQRRAQQERREGWERLRPEALFLHREARELARACGEPEPEPPDQKHGEAEQELERLEQEHARLSALYADLQREREEARVSNVFRRALGG